MIDKAPLWRAYRVFAVAGAVYVGGLLWVVFGLRPAPLWLIAHIEGVAVAWFLPFFLAAAWTLIQLFRVPLRPVSMSQRASEA